MGEVACSGLHGANRLASNSLLEGLVFAHRAVQPSIDQAERVLRKAGAHMHYAAAHADFSGMHQLALPARSHLQELHGHLDLAHYTLQQHFNLDPKRPQHSGIAWN